MNTIIKPVFSVSFNADQNNVKYFFANVAFLPHRSFWLPYFFSSNNYPVVAKISRENDFCAFTNARTLQ